MPLGASVGAPEDHTARTASGYRAVSVMGTDWS